MDRRIEVTVHLPELAEALKFLVTRLGPQLDRIEAQGARIMAIGTETKRVIDAINDATNAVAARIEKLISDADLTAEEKDAFQAEIDRLKALGADPSNPVPA